MREQPRRLSSAQEMRLFLGLFVQPFVAAGLAFVAFPVVEHTGRALHGRISVDPLDAAASLAAGVAIVAFLVTLCGAVPAVLWLVRRGPLTLKTVLLSGLVLGNAPVLIGAVLAGFGSGAFGAIRAIVFGSYLGFGSAFVFWVVTVRGSNRVREPAAD